MLRYGPETRGKRGAFRVIYWPDNPCERVYIVMAYAKVDKGALTSQEEDQLRRLAAELAEEDC